MRKYYLSGMQRESLALINLGTFLEYFDFKVYVHIAVILNVLFFPTTDPYTQSLLAAFSFSMAYVLRPVGSFFFGILGDMWGRKVNIIVTTLLMSITCFFMACMPTYAQIGWYASIAVLVCRIVQGIASGVEVVGAVVYTTESVKAPRCYFYTALIGVAAESGSLFALAACTLMLTIRPEDGWRYIFFLGSAIAVVGSIARVRLKESPEFINATKQRKIVNVKSLKLWETFKQTKRNTIAYFLLQMRGPFLFYMTYIGLNEFIARRYGYTPTDIIKHNLFLSLASFGTYIIFVCLTRYVFPFRLLKMIGWTLFGFSILLTGMLNESSGLVYISLAQGIMGCLNVTGISDAIFTRGFPVIGRYTIMGTAYSFARSITALTTSYACVVIASTFGLTGVFVLMIIIMGIHLTGLYLFEPCEEDREIEKNWSKEMKDTTHSSEKSNHITKKDDSVYVD
jgi:MFS transporter, MHS family, proline/betaine transporter